MNLVSETAVVFVREIRPQLRNPVALIFGMAQPLIFLILFGSLLPGSQWQWFVPGILIMTGLAGTVSAGYLLLTDITTGSLDRMLVTPISRASMLVGRTMKEVLTLLAQALLIIVVVLPLGFELHVFGALAGLLVLMALGIGLGSLSCALAVAARKQSSLFYVVQQILLFPLLMLSGVLLPLDTAPSWIHVLSRFNPLTYVVETERALFAGDFSPIPVLYGVVASISIAIVGVLVGGRAMRNVTL